MPPEAGEAGPLAHLLEERNIPARQVRVDYDEAQVSVDHMKDVLQEEDYPVESVA